jgi:hypothetical protein
MLGDYVETMADDVASAARARLLAALHTARDARRGVPDTLESEVRAFARASREGGLSIAELLIEVKGLVRANMGADEPLFTPKVVGWAVAGYFAGTGQG